MLLSKTESEYHENHTNNSAEKEPKTVLITYRYLAVLVKVTCPFIRTTLSVFLCTFLCIFRLLLFYSCCPVVCRVVMLLVCSAVYFAACLPTLLSRYLVILMDFGYKSLWAQTSYKKIQQQGGNNATGGSWQLAGDTAIVRSAKINDNHNSDVDAAQFTFD